MTKTYLKDLKVNFTYTTGVEAKAKPVREYLTKKDLKHLCTLDFRKKTSWQTINLELNFLAVPQPPITFLGTEVFYTPNFDKYTLEDLRQRLFDYYRSLKKALEIGDHLELFGDIMGAHIIDENCFTKEHLYPKFEYTQK